MHNFFKVADSLEGEIIWRLLDKVPDEWKFPQKIIALKGTPWGKFLWRKAWTQIKLEIEEQKKLEE